MPQDNFSVILREDFNVPIKDGKITDDTRIIAAIPSINQLLTQYKKIIIISHLGRPTPGIWQAQYSLQPVATRLAELLNTQVILAKNWLKESLPAGKIILCENVRFLPGELENDMRLSKKIAQLADAFVMDAFAVAHRKHASTYGVAKLAKQAIAGPLLLREIDNLNKALLQPQLPLVAVIGGAKISSKLSLLQSLITKVKVNSLIIGGGMANTFLLANGIDIGDSLCETNLTDTASRLLALAAEHNCKVLLPSDFVIGSNKILDIGLETIKTFTTELQTAATILLNGPMGLFEEPKYRVGTEKIMQAIAANTKAFSIAGGGETVSAINMFKLADSFSYISTAGGAFLAYLQDKNLPGLKNLKAVLTAC